MNRTFNLQLSTDTVDADAQQLGVTAEQLQHIQVNVRVALVENESVLSLCLTYRLQLPYTSLAAQLDWETWRLSNVSFTDYLWQQTCLECFIASNVPNKTAYIEINANPKGNYALYYFKDYRSPATLPPTPLLLADKGKKASIVWHDDDAKYDIKNRMKDLNLATNYLSMPVLPDDLKFGTPNLQKTSSLPCHQYQRSFSVDVSAMMTTEPSTLQIHPCVILRFGTTYLYYAQTHTAPPDFHQRTCWSNFIL